MYKHYLQNIKLLIKPILLLIGNIFGKSDYTNEVYKRGNTQKQLKAQPEFVINNDNSFLCDGCGLCKTVCPCKDAIQIEKETDADDVLTFEFKIDRSICISCGQCVEYCPQQALKFSDNFSDSSAKDKNDLIMELIKD